MVAGDGGGGGDDRDGDGTFCMEVILLMMRKDRVL